MHQIATQRVGPLAELPAVLLELGADVGEVFEGSGVDPSCVSPDLRMGFPELLHLLERAAQISGCPHIGLLFGLRFEVVKHHGIIGELMHSAPTLKQAFVDCVTWQLGYSSGAIVYLNQLDDEYAFGYGTYEVSSQGTRVLYDVIVCIAARMVHELSDGKAKVVEAHFAHSGSADTATYERLLRLPIRFNQNRTGVLVKAEAMRLKPPNANPKERKRLLSVIEAALWEKKPDFATRVGHVIRHQMHYKGLSMPAVASRMNMHPRTLRRRLKDEGTTFEDLSDRTRYAVARELLELTSIPISEISAFLCFASPGVFSNAFRRWSGTSASKWRRERPFENTQRDASDGP